VTIKKLRIVGFGGLALCAVGLLDGCTLPIDSAAGRLAQGDTAPPGQGMMPALAVRGPRASAWMDPKAKRGDLLYVSDTETSDVYVFSYPKGTLKSTLTGFSDPAGECVDKRGDVFITNTGQNDILEYAHGGTSPMATLSDSGYFPTGCSVDPTTGNLAVTNFTTTGSGQGDVVIYVHAKGSPKGNYTDPGIFEMFLCGYDASGNLFVDGLSQGSAFHFAELRKGGTALTNVRLNQSIALPGGVQWDGKYVAVGDQSTNTIYQFSISGKNGRKAGSTSLGGAGEIFQFWIAGSRVIGPDSSDANVKIWSYPAGGSAIKTISGVYVPLGAAVSQATRK
jgi:DNA-binding beta-propeller fold protein YncE